MKKDDLIKKLENLDLPKVELPSHQRRLKMALLARHSLGVGRLNSGYFKKQFTMSALLKKFSLPVGAVALVAIIAVGVISFTGQPSQASAQEIAKKTYQTVVNLPTDQQEAISRAVGFDSRTALQEAQNAEDLKALNYEEFAAGGTVPPDPDGRLHTLKFLRYTSANGLIVILGIDQNTNLPVFGSAMKQGADREAPEGKTFNTQFRGDKGDGQGLVECTTENGVEKCEKVSE